MDKHPLIGDVRGRGLMIGVELVRDRQTKERATDERDAVVNAAFERGLLLLGAGKNSIRFSPPLVLTSEQADTAVKIFDEALTEVEVATDHDDQRRTAEHARVCIGSACSAVSALIVVAVGAGVAGLSAPCREPGSRSGKPAKISRAASSSGAGTQLLRGATAGAVANWTSSRATARRSCSSK